MRCWISLMPALWSTLSVRQIADSALSPPRWLLYSCCLCTARAADAGPVPRRGAAVHHPWCVSALTDLKHSVCRILELLSSGFVVLLAVRSHGPHSNFSWTRIVNQRRITLIIRSFLLYAAWQREFAKWAPWMNVVRVCCFLLFLLGCLSCLAC
jgi:hypothetical protein